MKSKRIQRIFQGVALLAALTLSPFVYAYDENSGCRIVLCLANPKGPTAASECRPDISQMLRCYSKGKGCPVPSCDEGKQSGTYYNMRSDYYGLCQAGFTDSRGNQNNRGNRNGGNRQQKRLTGQNVFVVDSNAAASLPAKPSSENMQPTSKYVEALRKYHNNPAVGQQRNGGTSLACVPEGASYTTSSVCLQWSCSDGGRDCSCTQVGTVHTFNKPVSWNVMKRSPFVADVFVNNKIWHRARLDGDTSADVRADIEQTYY